MKMNKTAVKMLARENVSLINLLTVLLFSLLL